MEKTNTKRAGGPKPVPKDANAPSKELRRAKNLQLSPNRFCATSHCGGFVH